MSPLNPCTHLETHDVFNQPPPLAEMNLFASDIASREAVVRAGGGQHHERLSAFGARAGSAEAREWAMQANDNPPQLKSFDPSGRRIDEVDFHPAYHALMKLGLEAGVASCAWSGIPAGHVLHAALEFLMAQVEPGVCCPMTMTYASLAALEHQPEIANVWRPKILAARYNPSSRPATLKSGVTVGMAMTEKQGGSDVRANTTRAMPLSTPGPGQAYSLVGHKWFCSAPMSDAFLTLAKTEKGLTCFLVPRWTPEGDRNAIRIMRLKDKLGDRANASAEIEYHGAWAQMIGGDGKGVRTIIEMVQHTRLDCVLAPAAYMRQALVHALWHVSHRSAFERKLIDQPLMRQVLADMAIESEAATALAFRIAQSFDDAGSSSAAAAFCRIATPVAKYWLNKRVVSFVYEAMEVHGGSGYVEESVMPRIFRQSPLNSIWEGSGNVICLDVLRAMAREPDAVPAFVNAIEEAHGVYEPLDRLIDSMKDALVQAPDEQYARHLVEQMALALQGALLARHGPPAVSDAFCATRLAAHPGSSYGAIRAKIDTDAIVSRAMPAI